MARPKPKSRAQRWSDAVGAAQSAMDDLKDAMSELRSIQEEFESWKDNMSENLQQTRTYELLEAVCEIQLEDSLSEAEDALSEAESAELPLGFGRD